MTEAEPGYFDKCPKCGAPLSSTDEGDHMYVYRCGTIYCGGTCDSQSPRCYYDQKFTHVSDR